MTVIFDWSWGDPGSEDTFASSGSSFVSSEAGGAGNFF